MSKEENNTKKTELFKAHLIDIYPECGELLDKLELVMPKSSSSENIASAVVRIVIMQMLSEKAANMIYERIKASAQQKALKDWQLSLEDYRNAGISKTQAETIIRFAKYYNENKEIVNNWGGIERGRINKRDNQT